MNINEVAFIDGKRTYSHPEQLLIFTQCTRTFPIVNEVATFSFFFAKEVATFSSIKERRTFMIYGS
jgi:hypothetical protein